MLILWILYLGFVQPQFYFSYLWVVFVCYYDTRVPILSCTFLYAIQTKQIRLEISMILNIEFCALWLVEQPWENIHCSKLYLIKSWMANFCSRFSTASRVGGISVLTYNGFECWLEIKIKSSRPLMLVQHNIGGKRDFVNSIPCYVPRFVMLNMTYPYMIWVNNIYDSLTISIPLTWIVFDYRPP